MFGKSIVEYVFSMKEYITKNANLNTRLGQQFKNLNIELNNVTSNKNKLVKTNKYKTVIIILILFLFFLYVGIYQGNNITVNTNKEGQNIAKSSIIKYEYIERTK